ncbi:MAG: hypothetical protein ACEPOV_13130 [Hyphomicrobiales bacterium]
MLFLAIFAIALFIGVWITHIVWSYEHKKYIQFSILVLIALGLVTYEVITTRQCSSNIKYLEKKMRLEIPKGYQLIQCQSIQNKATKRRHLQLRIAIPQTQSDVFTDLIKNKKNYFTDDKSIKEYIKNSSLYRDGYNHLGYWIPSDTAIIYLEPQQFSNPNPIKGSYNIKTNLLHFIITQD